MDKVPSEASVEEQNAAVYQGVTAPAAIRRLTKESATNRLNPEPLTSGKHERTREFAPFV